jgi:hypothetical protein
MRGPLIGGKDFQLPLDKEASSRRGVLEGYQGGRRVSYVLGKSKGEEWKCEKEI